ncbi:MAG TPA: hypothetical protein VF035_05135 [Longimicrobiales bacterium]
MTDETRMEEGIARLAKQLDPPGDAPREEMWAAIQRARAEAAADAAAASQTGDAPGAADVTNVVAFPTAAPRSHAWLRYGAPLAAMLILGVGIGRMTMDRSSQNPQASADARGTGTADLGTQPEQTVAQRPATADTDTAADVTAAAPDPVLAQLDRPPVTRVTPNDGGPALARSTRSGSSSNAGTVVRDEATRTYDTMLPYRIVARRHFGRVQTLLVSLPADVREGHINDVAVRAADLLVNTRLLLDSPAAEDPDLRLLLGDLELILAQAATLSPTRSADDVEMIQNAVNQRDVLLRLRAATAGPRLAGT